MRSTLNAFDYRPHRWSSALFATGAPRIGGR
jgi:hypothetical protein